MDDQLELISGRVKNAEWAADNLDIWAGRMAAAGATNPRLWVEVADVRFVFECASGRSLPILDAALGVTSDDHRLEVWFVRDPDDLDDPIDRSRPR